MEFFNTTNLRGDDLSSAKSKADAQEKIILSLLRESVEPLAPFQIQERLKNDKDVYMLITSIGRSLRTLTKKDKLIKSEKPEVIGRWGRSNYTWRARE